MRSLVKPGISNGIDIYLHTVPLNQKSCAVLFTAKDSLLYSTNKPVTGACFESAIRKRSALFWDITQRDTGVLISP